MDLRKTEDGSNVRTSVCRGSEYTAEEVKFLRLVDQWKLDNHIRFPSLIDLFRLMKAMGVQDARAAGNGTDSGLPGD